MFENFSVQANTIIYSTQDGKQIDEDFVDKFNEKIEKVIDNIGDYIENELEMNSKKSLGKLKLKFFFSVII